MKFVMMVLVLVLFAACFFSLTVLAQNPPAVPANHPLDLTGQRQTGGAIDGGQDDDLVLIGGRLATLESQLASIRSARDSVARARIGELKDRVAALEDAKARLPTDLVGRAEVVVMIGDAIKAAGDATASPGDTGPGPPAAVEGLNFNQKLGKIEQNLSAWIVRLQEQINVLNDRLQWAEYRLRRRAIWFDAGAQTVVYRGGAALGPVGAFNWPLGQDGDFVARASIGVGQGWRYFTDTPDRRRTLGWATQVDLLYRGENTFLGFGPTLALVGQTGPTGNVLMFPSGGLAARAGPFRLDALLGSVSTSTGGESKFGYGGTFSLLIPFL